MIIQRLAIKANPAGTYLRKSSKSHGKAHLRTGNEHQSHESLSPQSNYELHVFSFGVLQ